MSREQKYLRPYEVTMTVLYHVEAESHEQAAKIVTEGAEYPLISDGYNNYCDEAFVTGVEDVGDEPE